MMFTHVEAPMFSVNGVLLNEYELRTLQAEVAEGLHKESFVITDRLGVTTVMREDGIIRNVPDGMNLNGDLAWRCLLAQKSK